MDDEGRRANTPEVSSQLPGAVVRPGSTTASSSPAQAPIIENAHKFNAAEEPDQYLPAQQPAQVETDADGGLNWTGPEFVAHEKNAGWYAKTIVIALVLAVISYLLTRDLVTAIMMVIVAVFLCIYSTRKPREIPYRLDENGIGIGPKNYVYEEFRYFTAFPEGRYVAITFIPLKRFSLPAGMCYEGKEAEKIIAALSKKLPFEQHKPDIIDNIMQSIRF